MLQISYDAEKQTRDLVIDIESEEQLVVETVLLLKEIKHQLMFNAGKDLGLDMYNSIIETANN